MAIIFRPFFSNRDKGLFLPRLHVFRQGLGSICQAMCTYGICMSFLCMSPRAWALDPETAFNQYAHDVWQAEQGLPQNSIQAMEQTPDGYLWLGTQEGLVRFDGIEFFVFDKSNVPEMHNNDIRSLTLGPENTLWMGNGAGQVFCIRDHEFIPVMAKGNKATITELLHDSQGKLWIGTQGNGLWEMVEGGPAIKSRFSQRLPSANISVLLEDDAGYLWVGTQDRGLAQLNNDAIRVFGRDDGLSGLDISTLLEYPSGTILIGTDNHGLYRFSENTFTPFALACQLSSKAISSLCMDADTNLWVGTDGGGLNLITEDGVTQIPLVAISHRNIAGILVDQEENLWIGTNGGGTSLSQAAHDH